MKLKRHELPLLAAIASAISLFWVIYWLDNGKLVTSYQLTNLPRILDGCLVVGFFALWRLFAASDSDDGLLENPAMRDGALCGLIAGLSFFQFAILAGHPMIISSVVMIMVIAIVITIIILDAMGKSLVYTTTMWHNLRTSGRTIKSTGVNESLALFSGLVPGCWLAFGLTFGTAAAYAFFPIFLLMIFGISIFTAEETNM